LKSIFVQIDICPANASLARFNAPSLEDGGLEQFAIREFLDGFWDGRLQLLAKAAESEERRKQDDDGE